MTCANPSLAGLHDAPNHFQISVPVQPGNSGGPLADVRGGVVGVVVARLSDYSTLRMSGAIPQNVNYAVKGSGLMTLAKRVPEPAARIKAGGSGGAERSEDAIRRVEEASGLVITY